MAFAMQGSLPERFYRACYFAGLGILGVLCGLGLVRSIHNSGGLPGPLPERYEEANRLVQENRMLDGLKEYERAALINPEPSTFKHLGQFLGNLNRHGEAIEAYQNAYAYGEREVRENLAVSLMEEKRVEEAIQLLREELAANPKKVTARMHLGMALERNGQMEEALRMYREAVTLDEDNANARSNLGVALAMVGDRDGGRKQLEAALNIEPTHLDALMNLGVMSAQDGDMDMAVRHFEVAVTDHPNDAKARMSLARALSANGKKRAAETELEKAVELDPNLTEAKHLLYTLRAERTAPGAKVEQ